MKTLKDICLLQMERNGIDVREKFGGTFIYPRPLHPILEFHIEGLWMAPIDFVAEIRIIIEFTGLYHLTIKLSAPDMNGRYGIKDIFDNVFQLFPHGDVEKIYQSVNTLIVDVQKIVNQKGWFVGVNLKNPLNNNMISILEERTPKFIDDISTKKWLQLIMTSIFNDETNSLFRNKLRLNVLQIDPHISTYNKSPT